MLTVKGELEVDLAKLARGLPELNVRSPELLKLARGEDC